MKFKLIINYYKFQILQNLWLYPRALIHSNQNSLRKLIYLRKASLISQMDASGNRGK